jgi:hypothetical protein
MIGAPNANERRGNRNPRPVSEWGTDPAKSKGLGCSAYNQLMSKSLAFALTALLLAAGCASRDVQKDLQIVDVRSGWYDLGQMPDQPENIKIVPGVTFRLKNVSAEAIAGVEIDGVFRNVKEDKVIDEHYVKAIPSVQPLEAGATSDPIVLKSRFGFTGSESRPQMFKNSLFVDYNITILGKHGRNNWARMAMVQIERAAINR